MHMGLERLGLGLDRFQPPNPSKDWEKLAISYKDNRLVETKGREGEREKGDTSFLFLGGTHGCSVTHEVASERH